MAKVSIVTFWGDAFCHRFLVYRNRLSWQAKKRKLTSQSEYGLLASPPRRRARNGQKAVSLEPRLRPFCALCSAIAYASHRQMSKETQNPSEEGAYADIRCLRSVLYTHTVHPIRKRVYCQPRVVGPPCGRATTGSSSCTRMSIPTWASPMGLIL